MANTPKPVSFTRVASLPAESNTPQPFVIVGALPSAALPAATTAVAGAVRRAAPVTDSTVANATDLPTAIALVNDLKAKLNAVLTSQRTAGQI